jgi:hypothetical protein
MIGMKAAIAQPMSSPFKEAEGVFSGFNRYGLPGAVIGAQFLIIGALLYVMVTALQQNTKAMSEMTGAVNRLTETIKDRGK